METIEQIVEVPVIPLQVTIKNVDYTDNVSGNPHAETPLSSPVRRIMQQEEEETRKEESQEGSEDVLNMILGEPEEIHQTNHPDPAWGTIPLNTNA